MQKNTLTILSLNTWHGKLLPDIIDYLTSVIDTVDVFCLQEANGEISSALDTLLLPDFDGVYMEKQGNDAFYRLATYVRRTVLISTTKELLLADGDTGAALACTLVTRSGKQITVTSVHGQPRPGHKLDTHPRLRQSREIIEFSNQQDDTSVVIGDFNLMPDSISVKMFTENNHRNLITDFNIPTTRNRHAWEQYPDNKQLYADYAFIRSEDTHYDFSVTTNEVSDHLPLVLTLKNI